MLLAQIAEAMEQMLIAIEANQAGNIDQAEPPEVAANLLTSSSNDSIIGPERSRPAALDPHIL
ncbi:MAG: hypothetical protein GTO49_18855 [Anaerolineae bacterium]|nr:hypothetical protein [Anaerolineae bacterium]